ncbi:hypothetical protein [Mucilaginibacter lacusdianchii]|uniref:hypothetical protein n=1 Tax=Mucilaginibacter lacusdianchii TaxID=2684211 RepID=UPI00131AC106|nr:hypothetical protein [Mucilaginibacter sp. JXJ CY 39]
MSNNINITSELITNYLHAEIMAPDAAFQAVQTSAGYALLFSVGTDHVFYVTEETSADTANGWTKTNLTSKFLSTALPNAQVKTFSVGQDIHSGTIGMGMVATLSGTDHLLLCLNNSSTDTSWLQQPVWVNYPFDAPGTQPAQIEIVNVYLTETAQGQFIVADIIRDPSSAVQLIERFYINTSKTSGYAWTPHSLPVDFEASAYLSCLGRSAGALVDGTYTGGQVNGSAQLIYNALYNPFNPNVAPSAAVLQLPGNLVPESIAACRNADGTTDLYVTAKGSLYYFAANNQVNGATAVLLYAHSMFINVAKLYASLVNGIVTVWGLNSADNIFYTSCAASALTAGTGQWSMPVPLLTNVDMISPYVNVVNNGNTIFAVGGSNLYILAKSPETGLWKTAQVLLPASDATMPAQKIDSYTTTISVTDATGQPVVKSAVQVSAATRTAFYVNNLYTVIDTTPIAINTDENGCITLIEAVNGLTAVSLTVTLAGSAPTSVNPMDKPFQKLAQLNTPGNIQTATIQTQTGASKPLLAANASSGDIQTAANAMQSLNTAYLKLNVTSGSAAVAALQKVPPAAATPHASGLLADFGDICHWLATGVENIVSIVEDAASTAWTFVVTIAGDVYNFVLNGVEQVVAAASWVFNKIVSGIEDLISFLKYLFDLEDIARAKGVLYNLFTLYMQNQVSLLSTYKQDFDTLMSNIEGDISKWAGISWDTFGAAGSSTVASNNKPVSGQSTSSNYLPYHFKNQAGNMQPASSTPASANNEDALNVVFNALKTEEANLQQVFGDLQSLGSQFSSLTLTQILQKIAGIIAEGVVSGIKVGVDAIFDFLTTITEDALSVLTTPVTIPIISDILSDFGVPSFSVLDVLCWVAAVPATIVYKIVFGQAPFAANAETEFLSQATTFDAITQAVPASTNQQAGAANAGVQNVAFAAQLPGSSQAPANQAAAINMIRLAPQPATGKLAGILGLSSSTCSSIFAFAQIATGVLFACYAQINGLEAANPQRVNPLTTPCTALSIACAVVPGIADTLFPQDPIKDSDWSTFNKIVVCLRVISKTYFWISRSTAATPGLATLAASASIYVDTVMVIPGLMCTIQHFTELAEEPSDSAFAIALVNEGSKLSSYVARVLYGAVTLTSAAADEVVPFMVFANILAGGLHATEGIIEMAAKNSSPGAIA